MMGLVPLGEETQRVPSPLVLPARRHKEEAGEHTGGGRHLHTRRGGLRQKLTLPAPVSQTSSPRTVVSAGGPSRLTLGQSRSFYLNVGTHGCRLTRAHGQDGSGYDEAGAPRTDDIMRAMTPWGNGIMGR